MDHSILVVRKRTCYTSERKSKYKKRKKRKIEEAIRLYIRCLPSASLGRKNRRNKEGKIEWERNGIDRREWVKEIIKKAYWNVWKLKQKTFHK